MESQGWCSYQSAEVNKAISFRNSWVGIQKQVWWNFFSGSHPTPPTPEQPRPLIIFLLKKKKKMAVMQPWLWFCTNMSFPLAFVKKRWNRIWTTWVATEILQLARLFFHVLTHTWTDCLNRQDLIYRCFNASICPLFSSWCFQRSWPWTGGFLSCLV